MGGMGVVYRARHIPRDREVAIKMIRQFLLDSPSARDRFDREARIMKSLLHPRIATIHQIGEQEGRPYFSMDYFPNGSMDRHIPGPLTSREAAELMAKIAEGMAFAHERDFMHRDLKPKNVLIDANREPKIADFGLARQVDAGSLLTQPGMEPGTFSYMSPEQILSQSALTLSTDVFSLGVIFFELMTGMHPFS